MTYITKTKSIKLRLGTSTRGIDWEEDDPGNGCPDETDQNRCLEKSEIQICVKRGMLEDELVVKLPDGSDPLEASKT